MKRTQAYFLLLVWGTITLGVLITHYRTPEPEARVYATGDVLVDLPPLAAPRGETELRGRVVWPDGKPAADCEVCLFRAELEPGTAAPLHWTFTDEAGRFSFSDLGNGSFRVALLTPQAAPTTFDTELPTAGEVEWTLSPPIQALEVLPELERTSIAGRIHLHGDLNPSDHRLDEYEVCLVPGPEVPMLQGAVIRRVRTDALGNFHFPLVAYGSYRLEVLPPWARGGTWPVVAARELVASKERNLADALEIPLAMGALRGIVTNHADAPIEGALIQVFPVEAEARENATATEERFWPPEGSDAEGVFVVRDLPAGIYTLRVRAGEAADEIGPLEVRSGEITEVPMRPLDTRRAQ